MYLCDTCSAVNVRILCYYGQNSRQRSYDLQQGTGWIYTRPPALSRNPRVSNPSKLSSFSPYTVLTERKLHVCMCVYVCRTPFRRCPTLGGQEIDLYLLYTLVTAQGGWMKVSVFNFYLFILKSTTTVNIFQPSSFELLR